MSWLIDEPLTARILLGVLALVLVIVWWRTRDRRWLYGVIGAVAVLFGIELAGAFLKTDGRRIKDSIDAMGDAVRRKDVDGIFRHITDDFRARTLDRAAFRNLVEGALRRGDVTEVVVWNREVVKLDRRGPTQGTATVHFDVKVKGPRVNESLFGNCEATFTLDKDGKWKLKTFEVFNPPPGPHEPMSIPGF